MAPEDARYLSEQFEDALEVWDEANWDWGDDDIPVPQCDLENPEICSACD